MVQFRIESDGAVLLKQTLMRFTAQAGNLDEPLDQMGDELAKIQKAEFAAEGKRGGKWAPLSPRYKQWKDKHYPGRKILERTGYMEGTLTDRPFGIDVIRNGVGLFGTDVPYARYHQDGTPFMPARPVLVTKFDRTDPFAKILQRWIVEGLARP